MWMLLSLRFQIGELFNIISNCCVVLKNVRTSRHVNTKTWRTAYKHVIA